MAHVDRTSPTGRAQAPAPAADTARPRSLSLLAGTTAATVAPLTASAVAQRPGGGEGAAPARRTERCFVCDDAVAEQFVCPTCVRQRVRLNELARQQVTRLRATATAAFEAPQDPPRRLARERQRTDLRDRVAELRLMCDTIRRERDALELLVGQQRQKRDQRARQVKAGCDRARALSALVADRSTIVAVRREMDTTASNVRQALRSKLKKLLSFVQLSHDPQLARVLIADMQCYASGDLSVLPLEIVNASLGLAALTLELCAKLHCVELPHQVLFMGSTSYIRQRSIVAHQLVLTPAPEPPAHDTFGSVRPLYVDEELHLVDWLREGVGWLNYSIVYLCARLQLPVAKDQALQTLPNLVRAAAVHRFKSVDELAGAMTVTVDECTPPETMLPPLSEYHTRDQWELLDGDDAPREDGGPAAPTGPSLVDLAQRMLWLRWS